MAITEQEVEALKAEAQQLHQHYRRIKETNRSDASEVSGSEEIGNLRARYAEIESMLNAAENHSAEEIGHLSNFDVEPYRVHKPVTVDLASTHFVSRFFSLTSPRILISTVMLIFFVSLFLLVSNKYIGFFVVPSSSMEPTLIPNDKLVTIRKTEYDRGDVVVLEDPTEEGSFLVKRIVAKGNDEIYVNHGTIIVNSKPIKEPYIKEAIDYDFGPYRIPEDQIFVLGDNRNNSEDGHHWGRGVPLDSIIGQVKYIYAPSARLQVLPPMNQVFVLAGT